MGKVENNFWKNAYVKEMAVYYYPWFFGADLNVTTKFDINDLESSYLHDVKKYFTIYTPESAGERFNIQTAYEYLKRELSEDNSFSVDSDISIGILHSYKNLISTMSDYRFDTRRNSGSYGDLQNQTNKKILFELSLFQPFIEEILKNIDYYLKNIPELEKTNEIHLILIKRLENLIDILDKSNRYLLAAQHDYHNTWTWIKVNGFCCDITVRDLGFAKKDWRLARNNACHSILNVFEQLKNINAELCYKMLSLNGDMSIINETYNNGIAYIVNSSNYFCYLNEVEKQDVAKKKLLRKVKS